MTSTIPILPLSIPINIEVYKSYINVYTYFIRLYNIYLYTWFVSSKSHRGCLYLGTYYNLYNSLYS